MHSAFELGQQITIADLRAEIVAFKSAATVVRTEDGATARVPNNVLLDSIVIVHPRWNELGGAQSVASLEPGTIDVWPRKIENRDNKRL